MKLSAVTMIAFCAALLGCSDSDEPLQGWKESDVEIVNEGTAPGTSRQIVLPGDATTTPMTGTNFDTSTDLDMITDEQLGLEGDDMRVKALRQEGSNAGQIDPATGETSRRKPAGTMTAQQTEPEPARSSPAPAVSTTRQTTPSPRPTESDSEPQPEPAPEPAPPASDEDESESETAESEEEPEEEENIQQEESLPPIVIPAPDPQPERNDSPTATDTADR